MYILSLSQHGGDGGRNGTRIMMGWRKNDRERKEMLETERKEMRL
jgi:hypothetical protein